MDYKRTGLLTDGGPGQAGKDGDCVQPALRPHVPLDTAVSLARQPDSCVASATRARTLGARRPGCDVLQAGLRRSQHAQALPLLRLELVRAGLEQARHLRQRAQVEGAQGPGHPGKLRVTLGLRGAARGRSTRDSPQASSGVNGALYGALPSRQVRLRSTPRVRPLCRGSS